MSNLAPDQLTVSAVPLDSEMTPAAWRDYTGLIWQARLDAMTRQDYFGWMRRWLENQRWFMQTLVSFSSSAAAVTWWTKLPPEITGALITVAAIFAVWMQVSKIAERSATAADLVVGWSARASFWDDAWLKASSGNYVGSLQTLRAPEQALLRLEETLSAQNWKWLQARMQAHIVAVDQVVRLRAADAPGISTQTLPAPDAPVHAGGTRVADAPETDLDAEIDAEKSQQKITSRTRD